MLEYDSYCSYILVPYLKISADSRFALNPPGSNFLLVYTQILCSERALSSVRFGQWMNLGALANKIFGMRYVIDFGPHVKVG